MIARGFTRAGLFIQPAVALDLILPASQAPVALAVHPQTEHLLGFGWLLEPHDEVVLLPVMGLWERY